MDSSRARSPGRGRPRRHLLEMMDPRVLSGGDSAIRTADYVQRWTQQHAQMTPSSQTRAAAQPASMHTTSTRKRRSTVRPAQPTSAAVAAAPAVVVPVASVPAAAASPLSPRAQLRALRQLRGGVWSFDAAQGGLHFRPQNQAARRDPALRAQWERLDQRCERGEPAREEEKSWTRPHTASAADAAPSPTRALQLGIASVAAGSSAECGFSLSHLPPTRYPARAHTSCGSRPVSRMDLTATESRLHDTHASGGRHTPFAPTGASHGDVTQPMQTQEPTVPALLATARHAALLPVGAALHGLVSRKMPRVSAAIDGHADPAPVARRRTVQELVAQDARIDLRFHQRSVQRTKRGAIERHVQSTIAAAGSTARSRPSTSPEQGGSGNDNGGIQSRWLVAEAAATPSSPSPPPPATVRPDYSMPLYTHAAAFVDAAFDRPLRASGLAASPGSASGCLSPQQFNPALERGRGVHARDGEYATAAAAAAATALDDPPASLQPRPFRYDFPLACADGLSRMQPAREQLRREDRLPPAFYAARNMLEEQAARGDPTTLRLMDCAQTHRPLLEAASNAPQQLLLAEAPPGPTERTIDSPSSLVASGPFQFVAAYLQAAPVDQTVASSSAAQILSLLADDDAAETRTQGPWIESQPSLDRAFLQRLHEKLEASTDRSVAPARKPRKSAAQARSHALHSRDLAEQAAWSTVFAGPADAEEEEVKEQELLLQPPLPPPKPRAPSARSHAPSGTRPRSSKHPAVPAPAVLPSEALVTESAVWHYAAPRPPLAHLFPSPTRMAAHRARSSQSKRSKIRPNAASSRPRETTELGGRRDSESGSNQTAAAAHHSITAGIDGAAARVVHIPTVAARPQSITAIGPASDAQATFAPDLRSRPSLLSVTPDPEDDALLQVLPQSRASYSPVPVDAAAHQQLSERAPSSSDYPFEMASRAPSRSCEFGAPSSSPRSGSRPVSRASPVPPAPGRVDSSTPVRRKSALIRRSTAERRADAAVDVSAWATQSAQKLPPAIAPATATVVPPFPISSALPSSCRPIQSADRIAAVAATDSEQDVAAREQEFDPDADASTDPEEQVDPDADVSHSTDAAAAEDLDDLLAAAPVPVPQPSVLLSAAPSVSVAQAAECDPDAAADEDLDALLANHESTGEPGAALAVSAQPRYEQQLQQELLIESARSVATSRADAISADTQTADALGSAEAASVIEASASTAPVAEGGSSPLDEAADSPLHRTSSSSWEEDYAVQHVALPMMLPLPHPSVEPMPSTDAAVAPDTVAVEAAEAQETEAASVVAVEPQIDVEDESQDTAAARARAKRLRLQRQLTRRPTRLDSASVPNAPTDAAASAATSSAGALLSSSAAASDVDAEEAVLFEGLSDVSSDYEIEFQPDNWQSLPAPEGAEELEAAVREAAAARKKAGAAASASTKTRDRRITAQLQRSLPASKRSSTVAVKSPVHAPAAPPRAIAARSSKRSSLVTAAEADAVLSSGAHPRSKPLKSVSRRSSLVAACSSPSHSPVGASTSVPADPLAPLSLAQQSGELRVPPTASSSSSRAESRQRRNEGRRVRKKKAGVLVPVAQNVVPPVASDAVAASAGVAPSADPSSAGPNVAEHALEAASVPSLDIQAGDAARSDAAVAGEAVLAPHMAGPTVAPAAVATAVFDATVSDESPSAVVASDSVSAVVSAPAASSAAPSPPSNAFSNPSPILAAVTPSVSAAAADVDVAAPAVPAAAPALSSALAAELAALRREVELAAAATAAASVASVSPRKVRISSIKKRRGRRHKPTRTVFVSPRSEEEKAAALEAIRAAEARLAALSGTAPSTQQPTIDGAHRDVTTHADQPVQTRLEESATVPDAVVPSSADAASDSAAPIDPATAVDSVAILSLDEAATVTANAAATTASSTLSLLPFAAPVLLSARSSLSLSAAQQPADEFTAMSLAAARVLGPQIIRMQRLNDIEAAEEAAREAEAAAKAAAEEAIVEAKRDRLATIAAAAAASVAASLSQAPTHHDSAEDPDGS